MSHRAAFVVVLELGDAVAADTYRAVLGDPENLDPLGEDVLSVQVYDAPRSIAEQVADARS